jgi:O-antigen ligase
MEPVREAPIAASSLIVITPQNSLLLVSSETGLVGLIAWGFLAVGIVKFAVNGLRIRSASVPIATALILASIATFLQSLFDFPMSIPVVSALWAFLLGYAGGLGSKSRRRRAARSNAGSAATL